MIGARCAGADNELPLVAELQDEDSQKCRQERPCFPSSQRIDRATPGQHGNSGKQIGKAVEQADRVFADPAGNEGTGIGRQQTIGEAGEGKAQHHRPIAPVTERERGGEQLRAITGFGEQQGQKCRDQAIHGMCLLHESGGVSLRAGLPPRRAKLRMLPGADARRRSRRTGCQ